jgi:hypothetical protein
MDCYQTDSGAIGSITPNAKDYFPRHPNYPKENDRLELPQVDRILVSGNAQFPAHYLLHGPLT